MTDPARWSALNESEREVLRAAQEYSWTHRYRRLEAACDTMTSDDPPPTPIEMPDGWKAGSYVDDSVFWVNGFVRVAVDDAGIYVGDSEAEEIPHMPAAVLALALRSAGWRVEGPR